MLLGSAVKRAAHFPFLLCGCVEMFMIEHCNEVQRTCFLQCRCCLSTRLGGHLFACSSNAALPLLLAVLERAGWDPQVLHIKQTPAIGMPHGSHKNCGGCTECCGSDWSWTRHAVIHLMHHLCKPTSLSPLLAVLAGAGPNRTRDYLTARGFVYCVLVCN